MRTTKIILLIIIIIISGCAKVATYNPKKPPEKKNLFSKLQNQSTVEKLTKILSQRYEKRKGGYSRLVRAGFRYGDDAPMAIIELVDRDLNAKKVDVKKPVDTKADKQPATKSKEKEVEKKTKTKK